MQTGKQLWKSDYYGDEDESYTNTTLRKTVGADGITTFTNTV
jgi:hypothetical protein